VNQFQLWPIRPRPQPDELLSSWLRRIALAHTPKVHSFCHAVWPGLQIWNRDTDASAPAILTSVLAERTGVPAPDVEATTLRSFTGVLFEDLGSGSGHTDWILPIGIYHRTRRRPGLQWCPMCLAADEEPYYRRRWRLALASTCPRHGVVLADRCHDCGRPASPHRGQDPLCDACHADRRECPVELADSQALQFEHRLAELLSADARPWTQLEALHPLSLFGVVRQVMTVVGTGERSQGLREEIARHWGGDPAPPAEKQLEFMVTADRHRISALSARLMRGWPWLFVAHCADAGVWKSWAFGERRYGRSPFAYADPVIRFLTAA
jgi:hypothetical protein